MGGVVALFGGRRRVEELEVELARTRAALAEAGALDDWERAQRRQAAEQQLARVLHEEQAARIRLGQVQQELADLQSQVIETRADALVQEAGVYDYVHPLDSAVAYKEHLSRLKADIKTEVTARRAVTGTVDWTVNGSRTQGAKLVKDFSTLMLRAYNADADNCVRIVRAPGGAPRRAASPTSAMSSFPHRQERLLAANKWHTIKKRAAKNVTVTGGAGRAEPELLAGDPEVSATARSPAASPSVSHPDECEKPPLPAPRIWVVQPWSRLDLSAYGPRHRHDAHDVAAPR